MTNESQSVELGSISILIPPSKAGDEAAREALLRELKSYLEVTASRYMDPGLKQKADTSDIVQLSFLQIIENFESFRGKTSVELRSWIKQIVINEMRGVRRKFNTVKRNVKREVHIDRPTSAVHFTPADPQLTPSSEAVRAEQNQLVHQILADMSPDDAQVIRLRNIESLSFAEIGEQMNRSADAASQLWYRAILKFEERLRRAGDFE